MARKNSNEMSGWTGWAGFACIMLLLAGFFHVIAGFVALFTDRVYLIGEESLWALDYVQWGWIHVVAGLLAIWAASSLMQSHSFGRTAAVLVAVTSAVVSMTFVPIYPIWSLVIIAVDVLIIYAVSVHGDSLKD